MCIRDSPEGTRLDAVVQDAQQGGGKVSITTSFFGGEEIKTAGATMGIDNVNMEDYHVIRTVADLSVKPASVDTVRLNCDPHLSLIHISEPTRLLSISYAVF